MKLLSVFLSLAILFISPASLANEAYTILDQTDRPTLFDRENCTIYDSSAELFYSIDKRRRTLFTTRLLANDEVEVVDEIFADQLKGRCSDIQLQNQMLMIDVGWLVFFDLDSAGKPSLNSYIDSTNNDQGLAKDLYHSDKIALIPDSDYFAFISADQSVVTLNLATLANDTFELLSSYTLEGVSRTSQNDSIVYLPQHQRLVVHTNRAIYLFSDNNGMLEFVNSYNLADNVYPENWQTTSDGSRLFALVESTLAEIDLTLIDSELTYRNIAPRPDDAEPKFQLSESGDYAHWVQSYNSSDEWQFHLTDTNTGTTATYNNKDYPGLTDIPDEQLGSFTAGNQLCVLYNCFEFDELLQLSQVRIADPHSLAYLSTNLFGKLVKIGPKHFTNDGTNTQFWRVDDSGELIQLTNEKLTNIEGSAGLFVIDGIQTSENEWILLTGTDGYNRESELLKIRFDEENQLQITQQFRAASGHFTNLFINEASSSLFLIKDDFLDAGVVHCTYSEVIETCSTKTEIGEQFLGLNGADLFTHNGHNNALKKYTIVADVIELQKSVAFNRPQSFVAIPDNNQIVISDEDATFLMNYQSLDTISQVQGYGYFYDVDITNKQVFSTNNEKVLTIGEQNQLMLLDIENDPFEETNSTIYLPGTDSFVALTARFESDHIFLKLISDLSSFKLKNGVPAFGDIPESVILYQGDEFALDFNEVFNAGENSETKVFPLNLGSNHSFMTLENNVLTVDTQNLREDHQFELRYQVFSGGFSKTSTIEFQLINVNDAPVITDESTTDLLFVSTDYYGYLDSLFIDPDGDHLTYTVENAPDGLEISESVLFFYPEKTGVFTFTVTATDPSGASASVDITLNVQENPNSSSSSGGGSLHYLLILLVWVLGSKLVVRATKR